MNKIISYKKLSQKSQNKINDLMIKWVNTSFATLLDLISSLSLQHLTTSKEIKTFQLSVQSVLFVRINKSLLWLRFLAAQLLHNLFQFQYDHPIASGLIFRRINSPFFSVFEKLFIQKILFQLQENVWKHCCFVIVILLIDLPCLIKTFISFLLLRYLRIMSVLFSRIH